MNKRDFGEAFLVLSVSTVIGIAVGFPFHFIADNNWSLPVYMLLSGAAGLSIGFTARFLFGLVLSRLSSRPAASFLVTAIVIGIGTFFWSWLLTLELTFLSLVVVGCSEVIGLTATFLFWRYTRILNTHLKETQKSLGSKRSDS